MSGILSYIGKQENSQNQIFTDKNYSLNTYNEPKNFGINDNYAPYNTFRTNLGANYTNTALNLDFYKDGADTHRAPTENEHTRRSQSGRLSIVVKGEVTNVSEITECLEKYGYSFKSSKKAEIIAQLVEWFTVYGNFNTKDALLRAFNKVKGDISLVLYDDNTPNKLYAVRRGCPLFLGLAEKKAYVASKKEKLTNYKTKAIEIEDNNIAIIEDEGKISMQKLFN